MTRPRDHAVAARLERLTGSEVRDLRRTGSQHRWGHYRAVLADRRVVFAKAAGMSLGGVFEAEARGLEWLRCAGAAGVPEVIAWDDATVVVSWLEQEAPSMAAAERFGRDLARTHLSGAACFGAPWEGFIADLPLSNGCVPASPTDSAGPADGGLWAGWYAEHRVLPYLRRATDAGSAGPADAAVVEAALARAGELAGPPEPPSRIHGDCWSGNVLWSQARGWLVDPAAHGGHRETDLAMLALFGAPYLDRILASYAEAAPLADGWRARVPLHQLHPLAVHVCLFGPSYTGSLVTAARAVLAG